MKFKLVKYEQMYTRRGFKMQIVVNGLNIYELLKIIMCNAFESNVFSECKKNVLHCELKHFYSNEKY